MLVRAKQMLERNNEYPEEPTRPYSNHFDCKMNEKKKVTQWLLEKCLEQQVGSKPKIIRRNNKITLAMQAVYKTNGVDVEITVNKALNVNKGLVYIYGYSIVDFEAFIVGLAKQYGL